MIEKNVSTQTNAQGKFILDVPVGLGKAAAFRVPTIQRDQLQIRVLGQSERVVIVAFNFRGRLVSELLNLELERGEYALNPFAFSPK